MVAVMLINGLPSQVLGGKSPMEVMFGEKIDLRALRTFGCACFHVFSPIKHTNFSFMLKNVSISAQVLFTKATSVSVQMEGSLYHDTFGSTKVSFHLHLTLVQNCHQTQKLGTQFNQPLP